MKDPNEDCSYQNFFKRVTKPSEGRSGEGFESYPWQKRLSVWDGKVIAAVTAPTGAGKELGVVVPWLYAHCVGQTVPTRLVYALPTRSLVDQVYANLVEAVSKSGLDDLSTGQKLAR